MGLKFPPPQKIKLTAVVKGVCWLAVDGERRPLRLETGDVFVAPVERSYVLASDLKAFQLQLECGTERGWRVQLQPTASARIGQHAPTPA